MTIERVWVYAIAGAGILCLLVAVAAALHDYAWRDGNPPRCCAFLFLNGYQKRIATVFGTTGFILLVVLFVLKYNKVVP